MSSKTLKERYPNIFSTLEDDIDEVRFLVVVDENYDDDDSDEFDAIDPEDYNYLVYVTERLHGSLGEEGMVSFVKTLESRKEVELFYLSDVDLYGIQTSLNEEDIATMVLDIAEATIG